MPNRVLDTNKLLNHWHRYQSAGGKTPDGMEAWARTLIAIEQTDAVVTPVALEILGGDRDSRDRELTRSYLKPFRVIDEGKILPADWDEARRLIERIPRGPRPRARGLVDCLIRAISDRLNHEVWTSDQGMPRRSSRRNRGE